MSEFTGCDKCKNVNKSPHEEPCVNCTHNAQEHFSPMTNADRIRNMSYEELADMLHNIGSYVEDGEPLIDIFIGEEKTTISDDFGSIKEWLQEEVKEGNSHENVQTLPRRRNYRS